MVPYSPHATSCPSYPATFKGYNSSRCTEPRFAFEIVQFILSLHRPSATFWPCAAIVEQGRRLVESALLAARRSHSLASFGILVTIALERG
jgi:hypothetical protein